MCLPLFFLCLSITEYFKVESFGLCTRISSLKGHLAMHLCRTHPLPSAGKNMQRPSWPCLRGGGCWSAAGPLSEHLPHESPRYRTIASCLGTLCCLHTSIQPQAERPSCPDPLAITQLDCLSEGVCTRPIYIPSQICLTSPARRLSVSWLGQH